VGVQFVAAGYKFEPFVGIDYANGKVNSFTETNAASADLTVAAISANRNDLLAGISLTRASGTFRPYARAVYRSQFGTGGPDSVTAYFNGDPTTSFTVTGVPEGRHELDANTGVNWVFDDAGSLFVGYQGTFRSGHHSNGLNFGVRLEF
jgi:outer membrane autotransporter protein